MNFWNHIIIPALQIINKNATKKLSAEEINSNMIYYLCQFRMMYYSKYSEIIQQILQHPKYWKIAAIETNSVTTKPPKYILVLL